MILIYELVYLIVFIRHFFECDIYIHQIYSILKLKSLFQIITYLFITINIILSNNFLLKILVNSLIIHSKIPFDKKFWLTKYILS